MKRISKNTATSGHAAYQLLRELRATRATLTQQSQRTSTADHPSLFVSESAAARYLTRQEASVRQPLSNTLLDGDATIRFCEWHFRPVLEQSLQEEFYVLTLDNIHRVLRTHSITVGIVNATNVHPREVFRPAILDAATAIIVLHNHPSGDAKPSESDRKATRHLAKAGELLGISVLDHIILAREGSLSLRETEPSLFN